MEIMSFNSRKILFSAESYDTNFHLTPVDTTDKLLNSHWVLLSSVVVTDTNCSLCDEGCSGFVLQAGLLTSGCDLRSGRDNCHMQTHQLPHVIHRSWYRYQDADWSVKPLSVVVCLREVPLMHYCCCFATAGGSLPVCAGCKQRIYDEQYLQALNNDWHTACFRYSSPQRVHIMASLDVHLHTAERENVTYESVCKVKALRQEMDEALACDSSSWSANITTPSILQAHETGAATDFYFLLFFDVCQEKVIGLKKPKTSLMCLLKPAKLHYDLFVII